MRASLTAIAQAVHAEVLGDGSLEVNGVAGIPSARPDHLVFVEGEKNLRAALDSRAAAVITGEFARAIYAAETITKPLLICQSPKLAFARASRMLCPPPQHPPGIHPSAVVHPTARLGKEIAVAERVVIAADAEIGDRTCVGAGAVIGPGVHIGQDCQLYPNVTIYPGTRLGDRVIVHAGAVLGSDGFGYVHDPASGRYEKFPQMGSLEVEDDVEIGANATIDRGALEATRVHRGVKIDNLVHIGHNCRIGEDVVIAAQTGVSGSVVIEKNAIVGGQVGIAEHVRIQEGAILGAQSGVPSNKIVRGKGVIFWGTPARPIREYLKQLAWLARLAKKD